MADNSKIEWTDSTWQPITGCTLVSEGCRHCYAATLAAGRLRHHPSRAGLARVNAAGEAKFTGEVRFNDGWLDQPLRWRRPRRVFVCAHGDLFHEAVPDEWIDRVFAVMALCPQHTFQVLTKRPERARKYLNRLPDRQEGERAWPHNPLERIAFDAFEDMGRDGDVAATRAFEAVQDWPLPNVWLGTSVEDQAAADERIPHLLAAPAAVRFLSAEPLLGPIDLSGYYLSARLGFDRYPFPALKEEHRTKIVDMLDWCIVGGESGPGARPMHPDWARSLRDQCAAAGTAFFFKQWGEWAPVSEIGESDDLYHPAPECAPDASRRCRFANLVMHADGTIYDRNPADDYHRCATVGAFAAGAKAMSMLKIGKAAAGRLLDGRTHDDMPEARHG